MNRSLRFVDIIKKIYLGRYNDVVMYIPFNKWMAASHTVVISYKLPKKRPAVIFYASFNDMIDLKDLLEVNEKGCWLKTTRGGNEGVLSPLSDLSYYTWIERLRDDTAENGGSLF